MKNSIVNAYFFKSVFIIHQHIKKTTTKNPAKFPSKIRPDREIRIALLVFLLVPYMKHIRSYGTTFTD